MGPWTLTGGPMKLEVCEAVNDEKWVVYNGLGLCWWTRCVAKAVWFQDDCDPPAPNNLTSNN